MRISDWSSNVCSSDLSGEGRVARAWFLVYISQERRMGQQDSPCQPLLDSYRQTLRTLLRKRSQLLVEWAGKAAGSVRPLRGTGIAAKQQAPNNAPYDRLRGTGHQTPEGVDPERDGRGRRAQRTENDRT